MALVGRWMMIFFSFSFFGDDSILTCSSWCVCVCVCVCVCDIVLVWWCVVCCVCLCIFFSMNEECNGIQGFVRNGYKIQDYNDVRYV